MNRLVIMTTALCCAAIPAFAGSSSGSNAQSGAGAVAVVQQQIGGGSNGYSGGYTLRNTPDVGVSNYGGAANTCGIGGSVGVTLPGFGVGAGLAKEGQNCTDREWYKLMEITAEHARAVHDDQTAQMFHLWAVGIACKVDDVKDSAPPGYCGKPVPVVASAPPVSAPTPVVQQVAEAPKAPKKVPYWCQWAVKNKNPTEASRAYIAEQCER